MPYRGDLVIVTMAAWLTHPNRIKEPEIGAPRVVEAPHYRDDRYDRPDRPNQILAWVGIVAGVVFIVAVVFFSGYFIGRSAHGDFRGGYPHGMMGPSQTGPYGQMWPGMTGPGGMMGPNVQWPGQQSPTTAPTTPRP